MRSVYYAFRYRGKGIWPGGLDSLAVGLIFVGVTSFLFHATLRQTLQFSDDLSMFLLTGCILQRLYTHGKSPAVTRIITVVLVGGSHLHSFRGHSYPHVFLRNSGYIRLA